MTRTEGNVVETEESTAAIIARNNVAMLRCVCGSWRHIKDSFHSQLNEATLISSLNDAN